MIRQFRRDATASHAIFRLLAEFQEVPDLRLTTWQASRLFRLDAAVCQSLLDALVDTGVLVREAGGYYASAPSRTRRHPIGHGSRA